MCSRLQLVGTEEEEEEAKRDNYCLLQLSNPTQSIEREKKIHQVK